MVAAITSGGGGGGRAFETKPQSHTAISSPNRSTRFNSILLPSLAYCFAGSVSYAQSTVHEVQVTQFSRAECGRARLR